MILTKSDQNKVDIDQLIFEKVDSGKCRELLLIVPTNRKVRYLKREIINYAPQQSVPDINFETLATFSTKIFDESRNFNVNIISDSSAVVLLNQSFQEVELKYFNTYKREIPRGTLELVKNVVSEYKRQGINPEDIIRDADNLIGSEKFKALDIANIFSIYIQKSRNLNAFELGDIYKYLNDLTSEEFITSFRVIYPDVNSIIINGFDEFSQPEINLIDRLTDPSDTSLFITFDYYKFNNEIFEHLEKCYEKLISIGFREISDSSHSLFNEFRNTIRKKLFSIQKVKQNKPELDLIKIAASNPSSEIEIIAKEIKNLILNYQTNANEICVAFNQISEHSSLIRDVFKSYGIPFNLTDRYSLSNAAPVISLINFLEILENDFYYKNIYRAFSGRWIEIKGVDLSNLLAVSSNLKLVSGYKNWIGSIENVLEQIVNGYNEDDTNYLAKWHYEKAKSDIKKIFELLSVFKNKQSIDAFKKNLSALISTLNFAQKLVNDNAENIEKNVKAITVFLETLNEIFKLLHDEYGENKAFTLSFFLREIKTALLFSRYNIKERHDRGILVTSVNEIRGLKFKYLFLGGMVDGEFPARYQPAIFFSGEQRNQRNEFRHLLEERYRFYQSLCVPENKLYFTYSLRGFKKELTESSFITDLQKLYVVNKKAEEDYIPLVYSKEEFFIAAGTPEIDFYPELRTPKLVDYLKTDALRNNKPFSESPYAGFIIEQLSNEAKSKLISFKDKEFSASQLEEYAKCPFRYFVNRILSLETIEEPTEEIEAFEIGSLIHSILYNFYKQIKEKKILLTDCSDKNFKEAEKILFNIAREKIDRVGFTSPSSFFEREKIFGINGKKINSILYQFLLVECRPETGFRPEYFEHAFGNLSGDSCQTLKINNIKVRGKVDRIDINKQDKTFKVVDYKLSGRKPSKEDLLSGLSLQLPLYMYVSKIFIEAELSDELNPLAAEIYSLKLTQKDFGRKAISIEAKKDISDKDRIRMNEEIIKIASDSIKRYVNQIANGDFRLSQLKDRENKICSYCELKSICRIRDVN